MPFNVTLDFPPDLEEKVRHQSQNLAADVNEAYALELFRRGKLTQYELSRVLGLDHVDTEAWLKRRQVFEGSLTMADLESDRETLERVITRAR